MAVRKTRPRPAAPANDPPSKAPKRAASVVSLATHRAVVAERDQLRAERDEFGEKLTELADRVAAAERASGDILKTRAEYERVVAERDDVAGARDCYKAALEASDDRGDEMRQDLAKLRTLLQASCKREENANADAERLRRALLEQSMRAAEAECAERRTKREHELLDIRAPRREAYQHGGAK